MNIVGIYKITSPTGKIYVGQSCNMKKRFVKYKRLDCSIENNIKYSTLKYWIKNNNNYKYYIDEVI